MTRRPKKARPQKRARRTSKKVAARVEPDALDEFMAASASALGLKIDKSWLPAVRSNLQVTLRLGALVAEFPLPDDAELAPVFRA